VFERLLTSFQNILKIPELRTRILFTVGMLVVGRRVRFEPNAVDACPDRTKPLHHPLNGAAGHAGPPLRSRLAPSAPADGGPKGSSEINQQKSVPPGAPGCS